jgi:NAD(P)H-nitrite reductase large subunit
MQSFYDYIVIGAGIAGIKAAETIRKFDISGKILMINAEDRMPYKRTSISKRLSAGFQKEELALKPDEWFVQQTIEMVFGEVTQILLPTKQITIDNQVIRWNKLVLCVGSKPVEIDSDHNKSAGIFYFRNAADVDIIRSQINRNDEIVVIGGGVQGIELTEQMLLLGNKVSLIHHDNFLMNRYFDGFMSDHLHNLLTENGVKVFLKTKVKTILKTDNQGFTIETDQNIPVHCDKIIVSIGTRPDIDLAKLAGLKTNKGILVDLFLLTSHPDVYAAGDVAEHPDGLVTGLWHAAEKQGVIAGANAAGQNMQFENTIFRLKLNAFNQYYFSVNPKISDPDSESMVIRKDEKYYRFFFNENCLQGALMMNDKDNAKSLEEAVRMLRNRKEVSEAFS